MLSNLKFIWVIICLIISVNLAYGNEINELKDLLDKDTPLSDKVRYLDSMRDRVGDYLFSSADIDTLNYVFIEHQYEEDLAIDGKLNGRYQHINPEDKKMMDSIRASILEILLDESIDDETLTPDQITGITHNIVGELDSSYYLPFKIRYLSLKLLIKFNELKLNADDNRSATIRQIEEFVLAENPDLLRAVKEKKAAHDTKNFGDYREIVENFIFDPVLLEDSGVYNIDKNDKNNYYKTERKKVLKNYERYLLDHIKFFPITEHLKKLVELAFFNTQFKQFKPEYIGSMFALDMKETLLKIIPDISIHPDLRHYAVDVALRLLSHSDILHFKRFSMSLLKELQTIYSDPEETEEFRAKIKNEIIDINAVISKHNDMKELEYVLFNPNISVDDKIEYLNTMAEFGLYFSKKDLGLVKRVLDSDNIDIRVKTKFSSLVLYRTTVQDLIDVIGEDDISSMRYLCMVSGFNIPGPEVITKFVTKDLELPILFINRMDKPTVIKQFGRFNMWLKLIKFIDGTIKKYDDSIKKLVIRVCLDLLAKNKKDFEEFSSAFIEVLQKISSNPKESDELKNIADYILVKIKKGELSLRTASQDCVLNMML